MYLQQLELEHFRNYESLSLNFEESPVMALIGMNAQGKTNLLESIGFLAYGKSFRTPHALETLNWDRPHGRIKATVNDVDLEVFLQRKPEQKAFKKFSKVIPGKDFLGHLRIVIFTPEHLLLVGGSPKLRRQYFDRVLVQLHRDYVEALGQYQRILRQRNTLLRQISSGRAKISHLDPWDDQLIPQAQKIWARRMEFVNFLRENLGTLYQKLANSSDELTLNYEGSDERFDERLFAHRESDVRLGSTSVGPHRDDFTLLLNGHELAETGSRGECRSAVLALKLGEIDYVKQVSGEKPLLLLDDVFSELDQARQAHLGALLQDHQAIITTTSFDHVKDFPQVTVYEVTEGKLLKK